MSPLARSVILWVAGPLRFDGTEGHLGPVAPRLVWDFVGGSAAGTIRRWALVYNAGNRSFGLHDRRATPWDQSHSQYLTDLFRPIAVLRETLPRRSMISAFRAMLPEAEIAAAAALSIRWSARA